MLETYFPFFIDDEHGGHPSEFEYIHMLPVQFFDVVSRIGYPGKRHLPTAPEIGKVFRVFRPDRDYICPPVDEFLIVLAQLRQMRPAVRSLKTAVEDQHDSLFIFIIGKAYISAFGIFCVKIRRPDIHLNIGHFLPLVFLDFAAARKPAGKANSESEFFAFYFFSSFISALPLVSLVLAFKVLLDFTTASFFLAVTLTLLGLASDVLGRFISSTPLL